MADFQVITVQSSHHRACFPHGTVEFFIIVSAGFGQGFFFHFSFSLHSQLAQGLWIAFICDCMAQLARVSSKTICTLEHFKTGSIRSECNESLGL